MAEEIDLSMILDGYSKEVREKLKAAEKETAVETVKILRETSPKRSGKYARGWHQVSNPDGEGFVVANREPQLTHLLEFGHVTRNGGRTRNTPHIAPAEKQAQQALEVKVKKALGS